MPSPLPAHPDDWLREVAQHFSAAETTAELADDLDETQWVRHLQHQAMELCRTARSLSLHTANPEQAMDELDAIDDIAHRLRAGLPGDAHDVVSDAQLFLLFYLAAHVQAELIDETSVRTLVSACWPECAGAPGDDDDEPWPVTCPPPATAQEWAREIIVAFAVTSSPARLALSDGAEFKAQVDSLLHQATALALNNRGCHPPRAAIDQLITTILAMEADVAGMGPEWEDMQSIPPLAFSMYYVWVHLAMGISDEEQAMGVIHACTERLREFKTT